MSTNDELSPRKARLSDAKKALLEKMLRGADAANAYTRIPRRQGSGPVPLASAQQRLWFLESHVSAGTGAYNVSAALQLTGALHQGALERSLDELVRRHEALRTTFAVRDGEAQQVVSPELRLKLSVVELESLPAPEREAEVRRRAQEDARAPFELTRGPLMRATLLRLGAREHVLLFCVHHTVCDGWSVGVLIQELAVLYAAFSTGKPSPLPELEIQYPDFALWQREQLRGPRMEEQLAYWKQRLQGAPEVLELPTDRPRPAAQSFRGAHHVFELDEALTRALRALSSREGCTLFMTLLAGFEALLHRYTGQEDLLVGSIVANRNRAELAPLIGMFANTVALRAELSGELRFVELLHRCRETTLAAYAHQDLPFEQLVDALRIRRDMSRPPLFQVVFVMQNAPTGVLELPGLVLRQLDVESGTAKFDLTLAIEETRDGLRGTLEYNTDLFDAATIARMAEHFRHLLAGAAAHPEQRISHLPLLTEAERERFQARATPVFEPGARSLQHLFEQRVAERPDAVAVVDGERKLTYAELNAKANQLAHHLRGRGVGPDTLVGLCMERSADLVVGLLGILKAGGAYLPLDPTYPRDRLAFMLEDGGSRVLVTEERLLGQLPDVGVERLCLDRDWPRIAQEPAHDPDVALTPETLAYVIYTSGSTGRPKGVAVSHHNVLRLLAATQHWFHFDHQDVWTLFHSYAFDFSVWELWGALGHGGRLVVVPYLVSRSPEAFHGLLRSERVTVLNQTPSAFRQLIAADEALQGAGELALRLVIFGGEALDPSSLRPWFERHGDKHPTLVNMYGITETTVHVTYRPLSSADLRGGSMIGVGIPDLRVYVLDRHLQPVPTGVPGELFIGGAGVARGYLNRAELSAQRFVADPFSSEPGARMYRSGDLARLHADGDIEYLGRIDHQVKIRGFRIELGEIETALLQHPDVREAVVLALAGDPASGGDKRLVAYLVPRRQEGLTAELLRAFLKERLPEYMVPAVFVPLAALPLTHNGKLDRRALPAPDSARFESGSTFLPPQTPTEQLLADIWRQVLGVERVGLQDNFFELGGDSILSIRIVSQARERGLEFTVQELFQHQTLAELSRHVAERRASAPLAGAREPFALLPRQDREKLPAGIQDAYPLTRLQLGMLFHSAYSKEARAYHNITSLHLRIPFDAEALRASIAQLGARHAVLRTSFDLRTFSEPMQLVHERAELPVRIEDLRALSGAEQETKVRAWLETEAALLFDWTQAPLLRFTVHRRSEDSFQLTLTEHHAILDGWSVASLLTELFEEYLGRVRGAPAAAWPVPTLSFRDYVALERGSLDSEEHRRFWSNQLAEGASSPFLERPEAQESSSGQGAEREVELPAALSEGLMRVARACGVPLRSVLLAAHLRVLSTLTGSSEVITGASSNGRPEETDGERVLGLFLNTLPFRMSLPTGSWEALVRAVFQHEQEVMRFRRFPLAEIQKLQGGAALFRTSFNYTHFHVYGSLIERGIELLGSAFFQQTNFALLANFQQNPATSRVHLTLNYDPAVLSAGELEAIAGYYTRALRGIAETPSARHEARPLLSEAEQQRLLVDWNTQPPVPVSWQCIHERVAELARTRPEAPALVFEDTRLTYQELNQRANQLAHHLRSRGVGPDVPVALFLERSQDAIVALLGILKAGGAYVAMEPAYPARRLAFMLEDTRAPVIVTQERLLARLPEHQAHVVCMDRDAAMLASTRHEEPEPLARGDNLAYVIFTSGSTGRAKGVGVEHRHLASYVAGVSSRLGLPEGSSFATVSTLAADLGHTAIFPALASGGVLHVISDERLTDGRRLGDYFQQHGIDCLKLVPSHLAALLAAPNPQRLLPRRCLVLGGEALHWQLVDQIQALAPDCALFNHYGPTETTVGVATFPVPRAGQRPSSATAPIGRPLPGVRLYVLDRHMQPVPVGVPGELHVGGASVTRGYIGRPEATAERFILDPWSREGSGRLYRTGDLVRYLPGGEIEFLGRIDHQVKIRGFRVELHEIEHTLLEHPAIERAVVVTHELAGQKSLAAYVVPGAAKTVEPAELRTFLLQRVPDYMVPPALLVLSELPLTPNGKIDRQRLPAPQEERPAAATPAVAPRSATEEAVAAIWRQVLDRAEVGIHDKFFETGGDSLKSVRMFGLLSASFPQLTVADLFKYSTIASLSEYLDGLSQPSAQPAAEQIEGFEV